MRFETKKFGAGEESVVICALWGERSSCDDRNYNSRSDRNDSRMRNNDVSVDFRVLVPRGVKVGVNTINGAVTVDGATAEVGREHRQRRSGRVDDGRPRQRHQRQRQRARTDSADSTPMPTTWSSRR